MTRVFGALIAEAIMRTNTNTKKTRRNAFRISHLQKQNPATGVALGRA